MGIDRYSNSVRDDGRSKNEVVEFARPSPRKDNYKDLKMQQNDFKEETFFIFSLWQLMHFVVFD